MNAWRRKLQISTVLFAVLAMALLLTVVNKATATPTQQGYFIQSLNFNGITTTTINCGTYSPAIVPVQLVADVTTANTATVETLFSLDQDTNRYALGGVLSATVSTDTPAVASGVISQVELVANRMCIRVTPVNTFPITITAFIGIRTN